MAVYLMHYRENNAEHHKVRGAIPKLPRKTFLLFVGGGFSGLTFTHGSLVQI